LGNSLLSLFLVYLKTFAKALLSDFNWRARIIVTWTGAYGKDAASNIAP